MRRAEPGSRASRLWRRARRYVGVAFAALVIFVMVQAARALDWQEVRNAVLQTDPVTLVWVAFGALLSHALFACLDLLSRRYGGLRLSPSRVWLTATVCYAASLNLGALVGSVGLRVRLYRRQAVRAAAVSRMVLAGVCGNWSGYVALLAIAPWFASDAARARWTADIGGWPVSLLAAALCVAYVIACARGSVLRWRERRLPLPPLRVASAQLLVAATNWALMGALLWLSLGAELAYADVLIALLFAAVAGVVLHVPGGWGVLEFSVALLLSDQVPAARLVAGVLVYRACYYLLPFAIAVGSWLWLERGGVRARSRSGDQAQACDARPAVVSQ